MSGQYPRGKKAKTTSSTAPALTSIKLSGGKLYSTDANGNTKLIGTVSPAGSSSSSTSSSSGSIAYAIALGDL